LVIPNPAARHQNRRYSARIINGFCFPAGIFDSLALYWVLFIVFLQRGPLLPTKEELSTPREPGRRAAAVAVLLLPLLVLLPSPFTVSAPQDLL
jgi:hypothetical protein